jgi:16S rRNA (uracil1498-N3)-methyltransferase
METDRSGMSFSVQPMVKSSAGNHLPDVRSRRTNCVASDNIVTESFGSSTYAYPSMILAIGLLKGSKLDDIVRIATEAGVSLIIPLVTMRSAPAEHAGSRLERCRRIIAEAIGQSGSPTPTRMAEPMTLDELCREYPPVGKARLGLFFHETPLAQASIHRYCTGVPKEIVACVGPEGGFDDAEIRALQMGGFKPAWLGPTVLRAETAAVFAVASLRIVCLERFSWSTTESSE